MRAVVGPLLALVVAAALVALAALAMFAPPPAPGAEAEGTTRWSHGDPLVPRSRAFAAAEAAGSTAALTR